MKSLAEIIFDNKDIQDYEQDIERLKHYKTKVDEIIDKHQLTDSASFDANDISSILQTLKIYKDNLILNEVDSFKQKILTEPNVK